MWDGIHFFVVLDVLVAAVRAPTVTSAVLPPPDLPGKPQARRVKLSANSPAMTVMAYPNAQLFLQTLHATGDRVHLVTRWGVECARAIVAAFDWTSYVADVRELHAVPGCHLLGFASVDCEATWNVNSVLVVPERSLWHPLLAAQLIEVRHHRETLPKHPNEDNMVVTAAMWSSMELLYALCRCVTLAEWRVRYPGTPIACCSALSACHLFAFCRFYAPPLLLDEETMLLLSAHGGCTTTTEMEATHVLYPTSDDAVNSPTPSTTTSNASSATSTTSHDNSASDEEDGGSSTSSVTQTGSGSTASQSSGSEGVEADIHHDMPSSSRRDTSPDANTAQSRRLLRLRRGDESVTRVESTLRATELPGVPLRLAAPDGAATATTPASLNSNNPQAALVTRDWLRCCCRALRLLPLVPVDADAALRESLRTTGTLLCTMLPPEDAKPLPLAHFLHIAKLYHFAVDFINNGSLTQTLTRLQKLFGDLIKVRQVAEPGGGAPRADRGQREARLFLYRNERKRDRNAVASHLRLLASQFDYAMDHVRQEHRLLRCVTTGTQTSGPRYASIGVNTAESVTMIAPTKSEPSEDTASGAMKEDALDSSGAAEAAEWLQHLKNAEGKLLKSHHPSTTSSPVSLKRTRDVMSGATEELEKTISHETLPRADARAGDTTNLTSSAPVSILPPPPTGSPISDGADTVASLPSKDKRADNGGSSGDTANNVQHGAHDSGETADVTATPAAAAETATLPASILPPPTTTPATEAEWRRAMVTSPEIHQEQLGGRAATICYIPTYQLPPVEQPNLVQFLSSLPIFTESGARVEMEAMGVSCIFPSARDAADFLRVRYVEYGGIALHIFPLPDGHMPLVGSGVASDASARVIETGSRPPPHFPGDALAYPGSPSSETTYTADQLGSLGLRWTGEPAVQQQALSAFQDDLFRTLSEVPRHDTASTPTDVVTTALAGQTAGQRGDTTSQRGTPRAARSTRKERGERREPEGRRHRSERRHHHRHGSRTRSGSRTKRKA